MVISFTQSQTIVETSKTISQLTVLKMIDSPQQQTVTVLTAELSIPIVLWSPTTTPTYTQVGEWTDANVGARLVQLYGGTAS